MKKKTTITIILLLLVTLLLFARCKTTEEGVIKYTNNGRIVKGNAKHFQQRHDAKLKREEKLLTNKN